MFSSLSRWLLNTWGWKVTGRYPYEVPKLVICVAPHTSNWDFPVGVLVNSGQRLNANYVGKSSLFRWPLGYFMRWLGGVPVERSKPGSNFVAATVEAFAREPRLHLVIAPEGTRNKVDRFKTGFYHIARLAEVPIVLCTFNWQTRTVHFDENLFYPSGNEQKDMEYLWHYYKGVPGYVPSKGVH